LDQSINNRIVIDSMPILGLLGGVASGKSTVAQHFAALGATVLDADRAGHEVLQMPSVLAAARDRWGEGIFSISPAGQIDRSKLAKIVFAPPPDGPRERAYLESLTHEEIGRKLLAQAEAAQTKSTTKYCWAILDAPLLLEAGWDKLCKRLVFVEVPREERLRRAVARGWSEADFAARQAAQESLDFKRQRAADIIDNSGSAEHTYGQVLSLWKSLVEHPA
jgi:dephospho-CoA kinase